MHLHCYRLLGSLTDADDLVQETMLAAWLAFAGFEARSSLRTWLYQIATNRCLNARRANARRAQVAPVPPFDPPEPTRHGDLTWLQPYPDALLSETNGSAGPEGRAEAKETVRLAFVAALQRLPSRQAAVLVLRDVLCFSGAEAAAMLGTTETATKGMLQRARASLRADQVTFRPATHEQPSDESVAARFAEVFAAGDVEAVVALLTDDAWLAMPPVPHEYQGPDAIAAFLDASTTWRAGRELWLVPTRANAQPAFGCYLSQPGPRRVRRAGLIVVTFTGDKISRITRFLDDRVMDRFGFPA